MTDEQVNTVVYDGSDAILLVEMMEGGEFQQFCESRLFSNTLRVQQLHQLKAKHRSFCKEWS